MKLLRTSFLLILLTCVFLLSRASGSQERASPKEAEPQSKQSQLQKQKAGDQLKPIEIPPPIRDHSPSAQPNQISAKPETREQKSDSTQPADLNWWFNLFLVIFTGVLAGLGVMQASLMKRQATYMRRSNRRTRQSAEAAMETVKAMQDEFFSTHQPHISMRRVIITSDLPLNKGEFIYGTIQAVNWGETEAIIERSHCEVRWYRGGLPMQPLFWKNSDLYNDFIAKKLFCCLGKQSKESWQSLKAMSPLGMKLNR
jgi:hypothetical protein